MAAYATSTVIATLSGSFLIKFSCSDAIPKFDKSMLVNWLCYIACEVAKGFGLLVEFLFSS